VTPLFLALLEYHVRTERFDRTLHGGWSPYEPDCWIVAPWNRERSIQQARRIHDIIEEKYCLRLNGEGTQAPKREVSRMRFDEQVRVLAAHGHLIPADYSQRLRPVESRGEAPYPGHIGSGGRVIYQPPHETRRSR
jgi:hypothetical protein